VKSLKNWKVGASHVTGIMHDTWERSGCEINSMCMRPPTMYPKAPQTNVAQMRNPKEKGKVASECLKEEHK
jgi:hypothetical protein